VSRGGQVFLDLKFHDIPNTVAGAARSAVRLNVAMFNVHAAGGKEMVRVAVSAAEEEAAKLGSKRPLVLAITVLTSIDNEILDKELLVKFPMKDAVLHFAEIAKAAGADGVVASPHEVSLLRNACGPEFLIVTPGIRPAWAAAGDQKRITTPADAIRMGSDYVVVGRPILSAQSPVEAATAILEEIQDAAQR
jgi:orotidine-5'-phosphate decarboxylase